MTSPKPATELDRRRAQARRTAALVALAALSVYVLFWIGGVLRS